MAEAGDHGDRSTSAVMAKLQRSHDEMAGTLRMLAGALEHSAHWRPTMPGYLLQEIRTTLASATLTDEDREIVAGWAGVGDLS